MGETAMAGVEGSEALFWNPAGLAKLDPDAPRDLSLGFNNLVETAYSGSLAYARPSALGVFGAGLVYFSQSAQTGYNAQGNAEGDFKPHDMALTLTYARKISILLLGVNLKVIRSSLANVTGTAGAVDFGLQAFRVLEAGEGPIDVGFCVSNIGSQLQLGSSADRLPFQVRAGVLWHTVPFISTSLDFNMPIDEDPYISMGIEGNMKIGEKKNPWKAALRAGYNQKHTRSIEGFTGVTAGGGLDMGAMRLDYAWVPFGDLGTSNRVTLAFRF